MVTVKMNTREKERLCFVFTCALKCRVPVVLSKRLLFVLFVLSWWCVMIHDGFEDFADVDGLDITRRLNQG
jgi:hypothetical protein